MQSNSNQMQSQKTLENLIDSMIIQLIRSMENQSNDYIRLNLINSAANRTLIAFSWLPLTSIIKHEYKFYKSISNR